MSYVLHFTLGQKHVNNVKYEIQVAGCGLVVVNFNKQKVDQIVVGC